MANPIYMKKKKKVENKGLGGVNKQHQFFLEKHWVVGVRGQKEDGKCQDIKKKYFNFLLYILKQALKKAILKQIFVLLT